MKIFESVDSTNTYLKNNEECDAVMAFSQTAGRGRMGRTFQSPEGGIYMSFRVRGNAAEIASTLITAKAAVAVKRVIEKYSDKTVGIKWVNDLIIDGKKICGILAEACSNGVIIGIGINWDTEAFDNELRDIAGSVFKAHTRSRAEKEEVFRAIGKALADPAPNWLEEYRSSDVLIGKKVRILKAGECVGEGIANGIDEKAALHVLTADGEIELCTGEVSIRFE